MKNLFIKGLVPAVFTPMNADGSLNLAQIAPITEQLLSEGVSGFYVCGSTGEGPSLTREERMAVAEAYITAAAERVPIIVQVGHTSLEEAKLLAKHAEQQGADAISAIPPTYFKPKSLVVLIDCLSEIAVAAPSLPFYYYHIPHMTAVEIDVVSLLELAAERMPNFAGVKYSTTTVFELQACVNASAGRFNMLFGCDEMLLSGLVGGAHGAVGSTYNFAAPLYQRIINAFEQGDIASAQREQARAVEVVRILVEFSAANSAIKTMMKLIGLDCGPTRLPQSPLTPQQENSLKDKMDAIGFFDWGRR